MSVLNAALRVVFDGLLWPFRGLPPLVGLVVVSLLAAIGMLLVFKATSNQGKLALVKRAIHACLFEIRLHNDDLRAIARAQNEILLRNLTYLRLSVVPMLWMMPPLVLVVAQLQFHYGYRGLEPGRPVLLEVVLADGWRERVAGRPERPAITVEVPDGVRLDSKPVWVPQLREMSWRMVPEREGDHAILVRLGDETWSKTATTSSRVVRRSPLRPDGSFLQQLLYPAEAPLPRGGPIEAIRLQYPEADVSVFGLEMHWMIVFFVLSMAFAFALRNRLGVTI